MKKDSGSVILETGIVLPCFIFVVLVIYGFFGVFTTKNIMKHALVQTVESLSMDPYVMGKMNFHSEGEKWEGIDDMLFDLSFPAETLNYYSSKSNWYENDNIAERNRIVKQRFIGYLSEGDLIKFYQDMKGLHVEDLVLEMEVDSTNQTINVTMKYNYHYFIDVINAGKIPSSYSMKAKLWVAEE